MDQKKAQRGCALLAPTDEYVLSSNRLLTGCLHSTSKEQSLFRSESNMGNKSNHALKRSRSRSRCDLLSDTPRALPADNRRIRHLCVSLVAEQGGKLNTYRPPPTSREPTTSSVCSCDAHSFFVQLSGFSCRSLVAGLLSRDRGVTQPPLQNGSWCLIPGNLYYS
ncbi:hypothetical protein L873DRAFT_140060 [Choiromyces venosus 120613-1]|uniref:Uncharacterized protein n=1 Tax=Choiromyces venosus 120613-1 TaxID=1336337 RepID=A0A3N4J6W4_9PEZI|nr:hypothetical protein L873DRAFT_140060 [Choiromyces venosus 120613-1]